MRSTMPLLTFSSALTGLEHFLHNRADAEARVFIAVVLRGDVGLADDLREQ